MADKKVNIQITADAKQAEKTFQGIRQTFTDLSKSIDAFTSNIKSKWLEIFGGLAGAFASFKGAFDIAKEAGQFNDAVKAMKTQFGQDADVIIKKLKEVSGGTLAMKDIVVTANRAMALNVTKDVNVMAQLLNFAKIRAKALGTGTTEAFNDIVTGIGRGSPMILDNLGIITKGWDEEAKAAGKAFDSQFILNKVLAQAAEATSKASAELPGFSSRMSNISATMDDARIKLGEALIPVLENFIPLIKLLAESFAVLPDNVKVFGVVVAGVIPAVIALNAALGPMGLVLAGIGIAAGAAVIAFGQWKESTKSLSGELKILTDTQIKTEKALQSISLDAMEKQGVNASLALKKVSDELKALKQRRDDIISGKTPDFTGGLVSQLNDEISARERAIKKLNEQFEARKKEQSVLPSIQSENKNDEKSIFNDKETYAKAYADLVTNNEQSALQTRLKALEKLKTSTFATGEEIKSINEEIKNTNIKIAEEETQKKLEIMSSVVQTAQQIEQGISDIFAGFSSNRMKEFDNEQIRRTNALQAQLEQGLITEEQYATEKKAIDKDIARKKAEEERKLAEVQKALRITEIALNMASGIVSAYTPYIPILSEIRAGVVAAVGGVQMGIAAATPLPEIPAFAKGVSNFIGGAALVGEQGPEIVNLPMGSSVIPNNGLSSFGDAMNARAYTAQAVSGNSYDNRNMSSRVFNFNGTVVANDPQSFFEQMQQYLRENEGIA